ncbi:hypothetical protein FHS31_000565 [Sphingomonas vulcanisoli]|uniref:Uncharacterized protein n=1 Tax=Sphingomonas vulcanisoli TaxID=1658060 RepID=A0ABX0TN75_9SPHN|nr:hypothetical protein [Sphingomonas vulcanisoli]NIJ06983.1 hypothetical protein [Sphingomonas vulcanisoli]
MTDDQMIGVITIVCALILVGSGIARRRLDQRSMLGLIGIWVAIILAGVALARLWIAHHP